ncbi:MAG: hypothetical protein GC164_13645 [Phycisphaera sp.]|nr:hypothetical protein [Phycisphaera sp.]
MTKKTHRIVLGTVFALLAALTSAALNPVMAQDAPAPEAPAVAPDDADRAPVTDEQAGQAPASDTEVLPVIVAEVKGMVQVRENPDQPWLDAKAEMRVTQGAEFRTGLRSSVLLVIPPDQTVTLDRLGTITVLQAIKDNGTQTIRTDLGMKYGRTHYQIKEAQELHDSTIRTASATLAIRGSDVLVTDNALGFEVSAESEKGVLARLKDLQTSALIGKSQMVTITGEQASAAGYGKTNAYVNPQGAGAVLTLTEDMLNASLPGVGGDAFRGVKALQAQFEELGGTGVGVPQLDGPFTIVVSWNAVDLMSLTDLDLTVMVPGLGTISAANPTLGSQPTLYTHSGDYQNSVGGVEYVQAPITFVQGTHTVNIANNGSVNSQVYVNVFQGPLSTEIFSAGNSPNPNVYLAPGQTIQYQVTPQTLQNN